MCRINKDGCPICYDSGDIANCPALELELFISDSYGRYQGRALADAIGHVMAGQWLNLHLDDLDILRSGPDHDEYNDTLADVLDRAEYYSDDGPIWRLYQDSDIWCYRVV